MEYSNVSGGAVGNCKLTTITVATDALSARGIYAVTTKFNSNNQANRVEAYDSTTNSSDYSVSLSYKGDTVFTDANEFFVLDAAKKVKKLITPFDPTDPAGEKAVYDYKYDASNYLTSKTISSAIVPLPLVTFTYTWVGGDLVKVVGIATVGLTPQKILEANLEYDLSKQPKNFMYIFPDGFENFFYLNALDFGKKSTHLLKKITLTYSNAQGTPQGTFTTFITDAKFSTEGYLTEWYADGDSIDPFGIFAGRTLFSYKCN